jgi:hypothetical protein
MMTGTAKERVAREKELDVSAPAEQEWVVGECPRYPSSINVVVD